MLATLQPATESHDQVAVDATDRLLLDEAAAHLRSAHSGRPGRIAVIDDTCGALTLGLATAVASEVPGFPSTLQISTFQDSHAARGQLQRNAARLGDPAVRDLWSVADTAEEALQDADLVLVRLDKSLAALTELSRTIARHAAVTVTVLAGGRVKHMSRTMNEVLAHDFATVQARLARQKSRVLLAQGVREQALGASGDSTVPVTTALRERELPQDLVVHAYGGVFAGATLDRGTRTLLRHLPEMAPEAQQAMDLGCGSGILAVALAQSRPGVSVVATDDSWRAVASARATAHGADVLAAPGAPGVCVLWDDAAATVPEAGIDLVLCNPPFHLGAAVSTAPAHHVFEAAGRVLRPGGELWTVFNRHLHYGAVLRDLVGPTSVVSADPKFVVTRSVKH